MPGLCEWCMHREARTNSDLYCDECEQDREDEKCCWNGFRQYCRRQACRCRCHKTAPVAAEGGVMDEQAMGHEKFIETTGGGDWCWCCMGSCREQALDAERKAREQAEARVAALRTELAQLRTQMRYALFTLRMNYASYVRAAGLDVDEWRKWPAVAAADAALAATQPPAPDGGEP